MNQQKPDTTRAILSRLTALFRRKRLDADLDEELRAHIDLAIAENQKRGMSPKEARTAALRSFGGVAQVRESYRSQRGLPLLDQLIRDGRHGCRQLLREPGFALTAIFTLALGLGANTAVFSLINALLLRPLPVPHSEQLAVLHYLRTDDPDPDYSFSFPLFRSIEKHHDAFQSIAAFHNSAFQVRESSGTVRADGAMVSGEFFQMLETPPLLGRYLTPQDDQPGGANGFAIVLSEDYWRTRLQSAPDVIGRKLTIANAPFTIVGVMPRRFIGADPTRRVDIYAPLWAEPVIDAPYNSIASDFHSWWLRVLARRNPGISLEQANAALQATTNPILHDAIHDAQWIQAAEAHHFLLAAEPGSKGFSYLRATFSRPLSAVFALCALMLLLACLNLASLLMARSAARERELATRLAMGASRRRLVQQLMVESLLIALLGTAAGIVTAPAVSRSLATLVLGGHNRASLDTTLDSRVFLFVAVTAIIATLIIGLMPALRATSKNLHEQIKSGSHTLSAHKRKRLLPRILMALEVALALILLVGAGLLTTSLTRLYRTGLGFDAKGVVNLSLDMGKQSMDGDALTRWYQSYGESLRRQPGVRNVSFADITPMDGSIWTRDYHSSSSGGDREVYMNTIAPGFFETLQIPMLSGRDFLWNDALNSGRKIILSQTAANTLFPGRNALGQQVVSDKKSFEVIAIVGDVHIASIRKATAPNAYIPIAQSSSHKPSYTAVVRLVGPAAPLAAAARSLAAQTAPDIPAPIMISLSAQLDDSISSERMMAMLAGFFAICALLVTAIGLYGTLAYATARRTGEIGIRMALGAQRLQVIALIFRENVWIALSGSLAGLAVALVASRVLSSLLYGTSARDPLVLVASVAALLCVASTASLLPALRAAAIDPMKALRTE